MTTIKAREAFASRFDQQVDPEGLLDPVERARRADHARRAYMTGLALRSARARRRPRPGTPTPETPLIGGST